MITRRKNQNKVVILYKGNKVFFTESIETFPDYFHKDILCPLCFKKIHHDQVYLITNEYKLFPDLYVHKACVNSKKKCIERLILDFKKVEKDLTKIMKSQMYVWL